MNLAARLAECVDVGFVQNRIRSQRPFFLSIICVRGGQGRDNQVPHEITRPSVM